ncbi:MAG: decaprenyl-phosphate phosphoribosyltransferase [Elusimicrobia bacterium]|nr:decaprenyl-phosphate phosphoribosyltransferase [Elusimicrobiota bacterium]
MVKALLISIRPHQWLKNIIVFSGLIFSKNLFNTGLLLKTFLTFILFCFLTGGVYIINDIADIEKDKIHPYKSKRPISSGQITVPYAVTAAFLMILISLIGGFYLNLYLGWVLAGYFFLNLLYTFFLQYIIIMDILCISLGFVARVLAGGVPIQIEGSPWIMACTVLLALLLTLGKRKQEMVLLDGKAEQHRNVFRIYARIIDRIIMTTSILTVAVYLVYTISPGTINKFHTNYLIFTVPFVIYGVFRYNYLINKRNIEETVEIVLLKDFRLIVNTILWILISISIIYTGK